MFAALCANLTSALHEPGTTPIRIRRHPATRTHSRAGATTARTRLRAAVVQQDWKRTKCAATTVSVSLFSSAIVHKHSLRHGATPTQCARLPPRHSQRQKHVSLLLHGLAMHVRQRRYGSQRSNNATGPRSNPRPGQPRNGSRSRERLPGLSRSHGQRPSHNRNRVKASRSHDRASRTADRVSPVARANRHAVRRPATRIRVVRIRAVRNANDSDGLFAVR